MESNFPTLVDRSALRARRKRSSDSPTTFIRDDVHVELLERLAEVNREFNSIAIVGNSKGLLAKNLPSATFIAEEENLVFDDIKFDLIIHDLALHWANDPVGQLVQCRLALKPDGLFIGTLFGGQTLHELRTSLAQAEVAVSGGLSPRVAPMAEIRDLGALLQRAGYALPVADSFTLEVQYQNLIRLMQDLRGMGETNALNDRLKKFTRRQIFEESEKLYRENFGVENERIRATFEIVTLTGWAPDKSQPQALKPGSASARLADALGTSETKLGSPSDQN